MELVENDGCNELNVSTESNHVEGNPEENKTSANEENEQQPDPEDDAVGSGDENSRKRKGDTDSASDEETLEAKKHRWNELWQAIEIPPDLSKRQRKKYIRKVLWETKWKPQKRAKEKEKLKQKKLQAKLENKSLGPSRKMLKHSTMAKSNCKLRIALDFSFDHLMSDSDIGKCLKQLGNCYCLNRRAVNPLQFHVTNFSGKAKEQFDRTTPYHNWDVNFHEANHVDVFSKEDLVYLTSDSDNVLSTLDHSKVYIIGALVDHNRYKKCTLEVAVKQGISHAQLPIAEYLEMKSRKVLTINHVFQILIHVSEGSSWKDAFLNVIPQRKGAIERTPNLVTVEKMSSKETEELPPSQLGTKEYWDSVYQVEIQNFKSHGDVGEVWFGEDSALRIVRWLTKTDLITNEDPILDLGCGNGMMLVELAEEGFSNLTGVDYSERAVDLAKGVAKEKGFDHIKYSICDIVSDDILPEKFGIVIDKGTYDAISLNPENASAQRQTYKTNVSKLLRQKGLFVIASCNWTTDELKQFFESDFRFVAEIPAPKFQFGGKVGSSVSTVIFQQEN